MSDGDHQNSVNQIATSCGTLPIQLKLKPENYKNTFWPVITENKSRIWVYTLHQTEIHPLYDKYRRSKQKYAEQTPKQTSLFKLTY